jgi:hypothetical protein
MQGIPEIKVHVFSIRDIHRTNNIHTTCPRENIENIPRSLETNTMNIKNTNTFKTIQNNSLRTEINLPRETMETRQCFSQINLSIYPRITFSIHAASMF